MTYEIEDTLIVINSSNRVDTICTHKLFPKDIINWVVAVPHDQYEMYEGKFGREHTYPIPPDVPQYLSSQRQHVMKYFGQAYKYVWLMDDDLTFLKREIKIEVKKHGTKTKEFKKPVLKKCKEKHIKKMFLEVREHLKKIPVVAISTRLGNNRVLEDYDETNRVTRCYAMSTKAFKEVGATFAPFEPFLAQDFHMALCFLNAGHNNRILYTYAQSDFGSNADGGCSTYRNPEIQRRVFKWMEANHNEVSCKEKKSKCWKGYDAKRLDMNVSWKKAYKEVKKRSEGGLSAYFKKNK